MGIEHNSRFAKVKFSVLVDIFIIDLNRNDLRDEHIVASKVFYLGDLAFKRNGALCNNGGGNLGCGEGGKLHLRKFVGIFSGTHSAKIRRANKVIGGNVDNKFAAFGNDVVAPSFRADGDIGHGRAGVDDSGPCDGENVGVFNRSAGNKSSGKGRKKSCGFPNLFCHNILHGLFNDILLYHPANNSVNRKRSCLTAKWVACSGRLNQSEVRYFSACFLLWKTITFGLYFSRSARVFERLFLLNLNIAL